MIQAWQKEQKTNRYRLLNCAVRRLIVNADDFGLTAGVNRAIVEAHQKGIVTSATLMACGNAFQDAVELSRTVPELSIGCHVVLMDGIPILPEQTSTLLDKSASQPHEDQFHHSLGKFAISAIRGRYAQEEIKAEATAQIRKLQAYGVNVSHIDTHKHTHMFPKVLAPLLQSAKLCGVKSIRNPFESLRFKDVAGQPRIWKRAAQVKALQIYAHNFRRAVKQAGLCTSDGCLGIAATGEFDEKLMLTIISTMPEGTWELVCHPGYDDAALRSTSTRLLGSRELELSALTSRDNHKFLAEHQIELISYKDISAH